MSTDRSRAARLTRYLKSILRGEKEIKIATDAQRFLEAVRNESDHATCIERLIASPHAMQALQNGIRFIVTADFINQHTAPFILYLSDPIVKQLCNGQFLQQLLEVIVEPRTLWHGFLEALRAKQLNEDSTYAFAWMLYELLSLPANRRVDVTGDAQVITENGILTNSQCPKVRLLGHKVKNILLLRSLAFPTSTPGYVPGGRHDNDFPDFRRIAILPTSDEFLSNEKPFYLRADQIRDIESSKRIGVHLDNQFRLLREDLLYELREDVQIARGRGKGRRSAFILRKLSLAGMSCGDDKRRKPCALLVRCESGFESLIGESEDDRKKFLKENNYYLKHQSFGCLLRECDGEIVSFATVDRDIDALSQKPPVVTLTIHGGEALKKTLLCFRMYNDIEFRLVDTPIFAYEPILKCLQEQNDLQLAQELLLHECGAPVSKSSLVPRSITKVLEDCGNGNIQHVLQTAKSINLDLSQLDSLINGLTQSLGLIQGPPGTGKSFIGSLIAKVLHDHTREKILVICYTNHALDQFLEDLLNIGIKPNAIVRLGSKSTPRTHPLTLREQRFSYRRTETTWNVINSLRAEVDGMRDSLISTFATYKNFKVTSSSILEYLEFEEPRFYEAFHVPEEENGMQIVGPNSKAISSDYPYNCWARGKQQWGLRQPNFSPDSRSIWDMDYPARQLHIARWKQNLLQEHVESLQAQASIFNKRQDQLDKIWNEGTQQVLLSKRIIGCTTTAAAKYADDLRHVSPGVILVEEAGEILESHILSSISSQTKQVVLIGDHQQLRPKINHYGLSTEAGKGYDLNRSLFERLILAGYPHTTLSKQHRMCPEISTFVRQLSYPELEDDAKTKNRPLPRGLQDRVIFFNHEHPEANFKEISDRRDEGSKGSKRNEFEVEIILKIVKYVGQQGYGTDKLAVLTPYLGQLHLLRERLAKENDPVLNDLDSYDLVRAGLLSQASAKQSKRPIKISTIDNYQGEESEVVIASLTRSNQAGEIGFMAARERLNVLLSRARNILIMVGNSKTFTNSRKGKEFWVPFFSHLNKNSHIYDGLPVKCEQHPRITASLKTKEDFETECPDGGCPAPCGVKLTCGLHDCPSKCHQLADHSKMSCHKIIEWTCPRGHHTAKACSQVKGACRICNEEDRIANTKLMRDLALDAERERRQKEYARQLAEIEDEIAHERRLQRNEIENAERTKTLRQYREELAQLKATKSTKIGSISMKCEVKAQSVSKEHKDPLTAKGNDEPKEHTNAKSEETNKKSADPAGAKEDWEYQKSYQGARSKEIDTLMEMIGLEEIKEKFLTIKAMVDVNLRQNIDMKGERFGSVLLGNPGTGKTTVARLYAQFLSAAGVIPGNHFLETSGSMLANQGVSGCQMTIEKILNKGGGALFIDEAYQLVQNQNHGGAQVLNYLLTEIENLRGKVVFILAGYQRQMEEFFAHNPGLPSRFPHELKFNDYNDKELMQILEYGIKKKYKGKMKVEGGMGGLYCRIVARRIGHGRGREGFGNARAVENVLAQIAQRQAKRIKEERKLSQSAVDDLLFTREDLIGREPSQALENCSAWQKLQSMIGLSEVKKTLKALLDTIQYNYQRELDEKPIVEFGLNKVFLGSPGTGKTTVAKLYGQILVEIGLLSNGEVIVRNPSDFMGAVIGESEKKTKGILSATLGKVLVIDEAYGLYGGGKSDKGGTQKSDVFKTAIIDTIVAEVQSTPGEDRCVLLLGYKDQMEEMFQMVNPGLTRRFSLHSAFTFEDFSDDEMGQILDLKLSQQGFDTTSEGRRVALEVLNRARNRPNFGNAGEVDILLNSAKIDQQKRLSSNKRLQRATTSTLLPGDFDADFDRADRTETNIPLLFDGVIGCEEIIQKLEGYRLTVKNMRSLGMDPKEQVPFNFLFRGPPGTGKTSTARKMGKVYYDMGLLALADVVECSVTDLVGQYIGQTGPKTQTVLENALGKILFIDEAYRLAEGQFAKEAMDEIVDCITKPKFFQKLIIILAGYDADINRLMTVNPGLTSRFPESIQFTSLSPDECITLLTSLLQNQKKKVQKHGIFELSALESPSMDFFNGLREQLGILCGTLNWANARDIQTLAKAIFKKAVTSAVNGKLKVNEKTVTDEIEKMVAERLNRKVSLNSMIPSGSINHSKDLIVKSATDHNIDKPTTTDCNTASNQDTMPSPREDVSDGKDTQADSSVDLRDKGVTDDVWHQLQVDKISALQQEKAYQELVVNEANAQREIQELIETEGKGAADLKMPPIQVENELKSRHEKERLEREALRRKKEAELEAIQKKREAIKEMHRKEQQAQKKLKQMGVCCMGYIWIKQRGGYRCAGGSHFVSDAQLDM